MTTSLIFQKSLITSVRAFPSVQVRKFRTIEILRCYGNGDLPEKESVVSPADIHVVAIKPFKLVEGVTGREKKVIQVQQGTQRFSVQ